MKNDQPPAIDQSILTVDIEQELKTSYLDYAMSVIVGRALPDVRDGLKPVHRRILYAMYEMNNTHNRAYKKSARIVGNVVGKYHPHGDTAVYDTLVRMAQSFSLLHVLIQGQGNFGSVDGDAPAAMRYTEVRLQKIASELMTDLGKETVDFAPNYDDSEQEPVVLPASFPNLLLNGSSGIAVGMATNIPPHNLKELIDACIFLVNNPDAPTESLFEYVKGPDFPTGAIINGKQGIIDAYHTGRGKIRLRSCAEIENLEKNKQAIIVTELPYQINKARLIERIAHMVINKQIDGITNLRDESDKKGMRIMIEVRRGENAEVLLNKLYQMTDLETTYGINMVALSNRRPELFNLKGCLNAFLAHKREVIVKRTIFLLQQAKARLHILEGLSVALDNLDEVIQIIRKSPSPVEAKSELTQRKWQTKILASLLDKDSIIYKQTRISDASQWTTEGYFLSDKQAQSILDLRLQRLTGLEREKIFSEFKTLLEEVTEYIKILNDPQHLRNLMCEELAAISEQYAQPRKTVIWEDKLNLVTKDLIPKEQRVIVLSGDGYIKSQPVSDYKSQKRGGKGRQMKIKAEDQILSLLTVNSHDTILCFSSFGKAYWLNAYEVPLAGYQQKGQPIVNLIPLDPKEQVVNILPVSEYNDQQILMLTRLGTAKRVELSAFSRPRSSGIIAINIKENDNLVDVCLVEETDQIMIFVNSGRAIRFHASEIRKTGRQSAGVIGIRTNPGDHVVGFLKVVDDQDCVLCVCENGYGKRTRVREFPTIKRGGKGVFAIKTSKRNGQLIGAKIVDNDTEIIAVSEKGNTIRSFVSQISVSGRNTQGVRIINLEKLDRLVNIALIDPDPEGDESEEE